MENFKVTWQVKYYDHEPEITYLTEELIESKNLESLKDYLDENAMDHSPEMDVPHEDGDFNIEWVLIHDQSGKELYRDADFTDESLNNADVEDTSSPIAQEEVLEGLEVEYYDSGQKESEANYKDGVQHGKYTSWYENGQKELEENWVNGEKDGKFVFWNEDGQKLEEVSWKFGNLDGESNYWHDNGQLAQEENWLDGNAHGKFITYYENGQKESEVNWSNDKQHGESITWDENGKIVSEEIYKDGEIQ